MIFGLVAALGWGLSDFWGAVASRRIGSLWVVLIAQGFAALEPPDQIGAHLFLHGTLLQRRCAPLTVLQFTEGLWLAHGY